MEDWIDYYDSTHTIYVSKLHRDLHFQLIARDIIGYIGSPHAAGLGSGLRRGVAGVRVALGGDGRESMQPALSGRAGARGARPADRPFCAEHEDPGALAGRCAED